VDVFVDLLLQLPEWLQRAFRECCEVSWILGQKFISIRFKDKLHLSPLFDGLVELFSRLNHNFILKRTFFKPGCRLTC
jgi:hypothetical protein